MSTEIGHNSEKNSIDAIIARLKLATGTTSDGELSEKFGYRRQAVNEWRKRQAIPLRTVFAKCDHCNEQWILTGDGPMRKSERKADDPEKILCEQLGRMVLDAMKLALPHLLESGTNKQENDSTADCRLPRPVQTEADEPFVMPTPPARQQAGPPPSPEAFERSQEGMRSPIRRS